MKQEDIRHPLSVKLAFPFIRAALKLFLLFLGPLRVSDRKRVPRDGALLIIANHLSYLDPPAVQLASPRLIHFMAGIELFEREDRITKFVKWWRAFPVRRGASDRRALAHALMLLKAGECVCLFPEGNLSEDGQLMPLQPGWFMLARKTGARVIAARVDGTQYVVPPGIEKFQKGKGPVTVRWSESITIPEGEENEVAQAMEAWAIEQLSPR
jgi:1-acyl-sn-glycerol-3-phosphate acyltransferase